MVLQQDKKQRSRIHGGLVFKASAFGNIETAPLPSTVQINFDKRSQIAVSIGDHVLTGQPLTLMDNQTVVSHASVSGLVTTISANTICIESDQSDSAYRYRKPQLKNRGDYQTFFRSMGLVGLGGAGFPVSDKLDSIKPRTLLINAAECDPAIYCDEALMQERSAKIIKGIEIALIATGATQCIIGIEANKSKAIEQMKKHLPDHMQMIRVPAIYPSGAERTLHTLCTGKSGRLKDNNTICFNVATCYAMYCAVNHLKPVISRIVTVVQKNAIRNFEVRIGTSLLELQNSLSEPLTDTLICGGKMMGRPVTSGHCVDKRSNSVLASNHQNHAPLPCIRCGACEEVCPENLLPQQLFWHTEPHNTSALNELNLDQCIECGCCDAVCPSHLPLAGLFGKARQHINTKKTEQEKAALAKYRYEKRLTRQNEQAVRQRRKLDSKTAVLTDKEKSEDAKKALIAKALQRKKSKKNPDPDQRPAQDT